MRTRSHQLRKRIAASLVLLLVAFVSLLSNASAIAQPTSDTRENTSESISGNVREDVRLPRLTPLSPTEALASFETQPGFVMELVAAEPLVVDPVAFAFDPRARLLVIEMIDYSERSEDCLGRLRRLQDNDGDGVMDQVETLAEKLSWPTALALFPQGTLVAAAPDLWMVDSPKPRLLFSGFGKSNVQALLNSFRWGIDNRWHAATSNNGATLKGDSLDKPLELRGRDFAIDPLSLDVHSVPGGGQHGMDFDSWGNKLLCSNSDHLQQAFAWQYPEIYDAPLSRPVAWRRSIAADGPQADVYRISPVEEWRKWRTELRVAKKVQGPVEGGGRAAGYFTGATGVVFYDGDQWGQQNSGEQAEPIALVADVGSNLVHRKALREKGLLWQGERIDAQSELLRSTDIWFRPVQLGDGPDGSLYIADMYREVIEHPASLPPMIKSQIDLNSGNDRGRIWRLRAKDQPIRRKLDKPLDEMSTTELVSLIDHPNGWHRETASRLLYFKQDSTAVAPLRELVKQSSRATSRLQALASLAGLPSGIDDAILSDALKDNHPRVRQIALWLMSRQKTNESFPRCQEALPGLAQDPSIHVRFSVAMLPATWFASPQQHAELLWNCIGKDWDNAELRGAIEYASSDVASVMLKRLISTQKDSADTVINASRPLWIEAWVFQAIRNSQITQLLSLAEEQMQAPSADTYSLLQAIGQSMDRTFGALSVEDKNLWQQFSSNKLESVFQATLTQNSQTQNPPTKETAAGMPENLPWSLLQRAPVAKRQAWLKLALVRSQPEKIQRTAIEQLVGADRETLDVLAERADQLSPALFSQAVISLSQKQAGIEWILKNVESHKWKSDQIPMEVWQELQRQPLEAVATRARSLQGMKREVTWAKSSQEYLAALNSDDKADENSIEPGRAIYRKLCISCHQIGSEGKTIGPGLASIMQKSNEQIALSIAESNREVDPKYQMYQAVTLDGEVIAGLLESSTEQSVTLKDSRGEIHQLSRDNLEQFKSSGKSLMPEGLLSEITPQEMKHLIGFLRAAVPTAIPTVSSVETTGLRIGTFSVDASPKIGSPLAYDPCVEITEPLSCRGVVLLGSGKPIVLATIDWLGIGNDAHDTFRALLAEAAGTEVERVSVHALHQHDAPRCDFAAEMILQQAGVTKQHYDRERTMEIFREAAKSVQVAIEKSEPFDQIGAGAAEVYEVASNRRLLGSDGNVIATRYTATKDPKLRDAPVGTIDPMLRCVSFWHGEQCRAVLTYYAVHPQSYYRTGQANPDFPGMARNVRQEELKIPHVHFNGAAGNIGAGKWNDGSKPNRAVLANKVADAMRRAWEGTTKRPIQPNQVQWDIKEVTLPAGAHQKVDDLRGVVNNPQAPDAQRVNAAEHLSFILRQQSGGTIDLGRLKLGEVQIFHMPGELFVEYQLAAQKIGREVTADSFVAMAAYGDYGTMYIGTGVAYTQGGYETSAGATCVGPDAEQILVNAMQELLGNGAKPTPTPPLGVPPDPPVQFSSSNQ